MLLGKALKKAAQMKNRLLKNNPRVRKQKVFDAYSFDEAYSVLSAYSKGEICVSPFVREAPGRKKSDQIAMDDAFIGALIKSIALIGYLAILTSCKGEAPRKERQSVCETSLKLAKHLTRHGVLLEYGSGGDVIIGGYSFRCRLYYAHCTGIFLLPEQPGKKVKGYFGSFPRWTLQKDPWPIDEALASEIIKYCETLL